jgi:hypothetical protein
MSCYMYTVRVSPATAALAGLLLLLPLLRLLPSGR